MGFWIYMLLMNLLLPVTMILLGKAFRKKAPKEINEVFGYRTSRSMRSKETWEFAHRFCGKIWLISGAALIPISLATMLCVIGKDTAVVGAVGAVLLVLPLVLMALTVIVTERALKNTFDKTDNKIAQKEADK